MDTNEILVALRAMRDEYSVSCAANESNYPGMDSDDLAIHMARDSAADELRDDIYRNLDSLITQIEGPSRGEIDDPYVGAHR